MRTRQPTSSASTSRPSGDAEVNAGAGLGLGDPAGASAWRRITSSIRGPGTAPGQTVFDPDAVWPEFECQTSGPAR